MPLPIIECPQLESLVPNPATRRRARFGLLLILAVYFPIVIASSAWLSPSADETPHIRSGMTLMTREAYVDPARAWWTRLDVVHPIADIAPALLARAAGASPDFRDHMFPAFGQIRAARWVNHLSGALILAIVFFWAESLWGALGALIATLFLAAYPLFLAHSSIVSSDLYMALGALAAAWTIWHFFISAPERLAAWGRPLWFAALAAGLATAFAMCCKLNNVVFVGVAGAAALWAAWRSRGADPPRVWLARGLAAATVAGGSALFVTTFVYEATHRTPLPITLRGHTIMLPFGQALLASLNAARKLYIIQPTVFFAGDLTPPRPWYYANSFLLKTPLPLLLLAPLAGCAALADARRRDPRPAACLLALLAGLALLFTTRKIFMGLRHLLPLIALLALLAGSLGQAIKSMEKQRASLLLGFIFFCLGWAGVEAVRATPWQLSYFNAFGRGRLIFVDSEGDWGQGLIALREWQRQFCPDRPVWLAYFGNADPADFGVNYRGLLAPYSQARQDPAAPPLARPADLAGEVVAISKTHLAGTYLQTAEKGPDYYEPWRSLKPDYEVGGSILIFDLRGIVK